MLGFGVGCQTQFTGDPHISPAACQAKCAQSNLQMAGMVYMGEYSSACICEVGKPGGASAGLASAGAVGAAPGVIMQMRRANAAAASAATPPPR